MRRRLTNILFLFSPVFLSPTLSRACAVCFSGGSADMTRGFFWGVVLLLSLPFAMFTVFFITVARVSKKKRNHENLAS